MPRRKPELAISEFTFAYNFLHEQQMIFQGEMIGLPILPSLLEEGEVGFDACLPTRSAIFFYQFKKSHYIVNLHPRRRDRNPQPYPVPFYRIYLHRHNHYAQHFQLQYWSYTYPGTFYIAPEITDNRTFYRAAQNNEIWMHCRSIPLRLIPERFDVTEKHFIEFKENNERPLLCSDHITEIKNSIMGEDLKKYCLEQKREPIDKLAMELSERTLSFIARYWEPQSIEKIEKIPFSKIPQKEEIAKSLLQSSSLLSTYLGIVPVLVGERK